MSETTTPSATSSSPASSSTSTTSPATVQPDPSPASTPSPVDAARRIAETLKASGAVKGSTGPDHGKIVGRGKRRTRIIQRSIVGLVVSDVAAVLTANGQADVAKELHMGSSAHAGEKTVTLWADDVFELLEQFEKSTAPVK